MSGCLISTVSAHCGCFLNLLEGCVAAGLLPPTDRLRRPTGSRGSPSWDSHENSCLCVEVELNSVIGYRATLGLCHSGRELQHLPVLPWGRRVRVTLPIWGDFQFSFLGREVSSM